VNRLLATVVVPTLVGCSSVGVHSQPPNHASEEATRDAELTALRVQNEDQEQQLRVLRGQLALARAEVQELKATDDREPAREAVAGGDAPPWAGARSDSEVPRVLELDGASIDERLPTTANVPDLPAFEEPPPAETSANTEVSVEGYRRALSLIREERFDDALIELDAFLAAHPSHAYSDNALFWCGEIHYLRHEYGKALQYFERIDKLYPWGNKAPDALYRLGQIYLRRGDKARARSYFDKVREQFPNTAAARLALREDAS